MSTIQCPICDRIDQIQRVTAIVEGETHDTTGGGETIGGSHIEGNTDHYMGRGFDRERVGDSRLSASSVNYSTTRFNVTKQSRLANKLARPASPAKPDYSLSPMSQKLVAFLAAIPAFFVWVLTANLAQSLDVGFFVDVLLLVVSFIPPTIAWVIVSDLLEKAILHSQYPAEERQHALAQYDYESKRWEVASKRWNAMYYCRRCDVVYVPGDSFEPMSPDDTLTLAYAGA